MVQIQLLVMLLIGTAACLAKERPRRPNPCASYAGGICPSSTDSEEEETSEEVLSLTGQVQKQQGRIEELQTQISNATTLSPTVAQDLKNQLTTVKEKANSLLQQLASSSLTANQLAAIKKDIATLETSVDQLRQQLQDQANTGDTGGGNQGGGNQGGGNQGGGNQGGGNQGGGNQGGGNQGGGDTGGDNQGGGNQGGGNQGGGNQGGGNQGGGDTGGDNQGGGNQGGGNKGATTTTTQTPTPYVYFADSNGYRVGFLLQPWDSSYAANMTAKITYGSFDLTVNTNNTFTLRLPVTLRYSLQGEEHCWHATLTEENLNARLNSDDFSTYQNGDLAIKQGAASKLQAMQHNTGGCL